MNRRFVRRARRAAFGAVIGAGIISGSIALVLVIAYGFDAYMDRVSLVRREDRETVIVAVPKAERFGTPIETAVRP